MQSADGTGFFIDEGLHAQAYAIGAGFEKRAENRIAERPRGAFDRYFGIVLNVEVFSHRLDDLFELHGVEQAWRSAAKIKAVHSALEIAAGHARQFFGRIQVAAEPIHIGLHRSEEHTSELQPPSFISY